MIASRFGFVLLVACGALVAGCGPTATPSATTKAGSAPTASPTAVAGSGPTATPTATAKASSGPTATPTAKASSGPTATPTAAATPTATPTSASSAAAVTYSIAPNAATYPLPGIGGFTGTLSLPASSVPNGAPNPATMTITAYAGTSNPPFLAGSVLPTFFTDVQGTPLLYFVVTNSAVTFTTFTGSMTLTSSATLPTTSQYYVGACTLSGDTSGRPDSTCSAEPLAASIYSIVGPIPQSGNTLSATTQTFLGGSFGAPTTLAAPGGLTYVAFLYSSQLGPELQAYRTQGFRGTDAAVQYIGPERP